MTRPLLAATGVALALFATACTPGRPLGAAPSSAPATLPATASTPVAPSAPASAGVTATQATVAAPGTSPVAPATTVATARATAPVSPASPDLAVATLRPLPADAVVDVTTFGADGSDDADDTAAFKAAMASTEKAIYLPIGEYVVSEQLAGRRADGSWRGGLWLVGEDRARTVIRLADAAAGFGDPAAPRAVIATGSYHFAENYGGDIGEGNEAYGNRIENLTVATGAAAGAVAIDYLGNNSGSIRHVSVTGQGPVGISMTRRYPGPALLSDVSVNGFGIGIDVAHPEYGITMDMIRLSGQRTVGIRNKSNVLSIADLRSSNSVPALRNSGGSGFVTLVDAVLDGGAPGVGAVENGAADGRTAGMVLRNTRSTGYASVLTDAGTTVPGDRVGLWSSGRTGAVDDAAITAVRAPDDHPPLAEWVNVADFGANGKDWLDDRAAIQKALDSGRSTVYFAPGRYFTSAPLRVPAGVRMIHGFGATLAPTFGAFSEAASATPMLSVADDATDPLVVAHLSFGKLHQASPIRGLVCVQHDSSRDLVLRSTACDRAEADAAYRGAAGAGRLFIEDSILTGIHIAAGQQVWARQLNSEGGEARVFNRGGRLWVLGIKTEGDDTVIETSDGGRTELVGGLLYPVGPVAADHAAFITSGGATAVLSYVTSAWKSGAEYAQQVRAQDGQSSLTAKELPGRTAHGHTVVLHATGP